MLCKKHNLQVMGCSKRVRDDPGDICLECIEIEPSGGLNEKTPPDGQGNELPPVKHHYSAIKHRSNGVILIPTREPLPHFGEKGRRHGKGAE